MKSLTLEGTERKQFGSKHAAQFRRDEFIPCVLYGGTETVHFYAPYNAFHKIVYNPDFFTVKVTVHGKEYTTLVREVQTHPVTDRITHIDFLELAPGKKVTAEIPLKLTGQAAGVKAGGVLDQKLRKLKVRAMVNDLVEHVEISVANLELGKSIKVSDIKIPNVEILNLPYFPVASVYIPRVIEEPTAAAAAVPAEGAAAPAAEGAAPAAGAAPAKPGAEGEKKTEGKPEAKAEKKSEGKEKK